MNETGGVVRGEGEPVRLSHPTGCIIPLNDKTLAILAAALTKASRKVSHPSDLRVSQGHANLPTSGERDSAEVSAVKSPGFGVPRASVTTEIVAPQGFGATPVFILRGDEGGSLDRKEAPMEYVVGDGSLLRRAREMYPCNGTHPAAKDSPAHRSDQIDIEVGRAHVRACELSILPGDLYVEYVGESPAYASGDRYSLQCAKVFLPINSDWLATAIRLRSMAGAR